MLPMNDETKFFVTNIVQLAYKMYKRTWSTLYLFKVAAEIQIMLFNYVSITTMFIQDISTLYRGRGNFGDSFMKCALAIT